MRHQLSAYLFNAITFLLLLVAGITPLLFLNQTTEFYEMPKLVFLVVTTVLLYGLWIFSWIIRGKIAITRTPLDFPLLVLLIVVLASTYFSETRFAAVYGNFPRVHGSAISWVTYILLYFVTVSNLKSLSQIRTFLYVLYGSAVAVAVISLLSFFNFFLPIDFAKTVNFTPTGSSFSTVALLLLLLPFSLLSIVNPNKYLPMPFATVLTILFGVTIILIGSWTSYIALAIIFVLSMFVSKPQQVKKSIPMLLLPVLVITLTLVLAYFPLPGNLGALQKLETNYPKEIQLPFPISWKVSASAFRDAPFIGTGPSTYLFNFTNYKPTEFNQLRFWNFSFDTAHNEFLQVLGTLGLFGFLAIIALCLFVINNSRKNLAIVAPEDGTHDGMHILLPAFAISGLASILLLAMHATTLVSTVVTLLIFALLMVSQKSIRAKVMELSLGIRASSSGDKQFDLMPVLLFIIFLAGAIPLLYKTYTVVMADYNHRLALSQANQNGTLTYQYLQRAESLNPHIDLYRVDMAQTNFALANAIAAQKGPTDANPKGTLTDQDRRTIQTLLSQAINEGRASVALSPRSSRNWTVLAAIYRNITGVANNALTFSLDAYGRAIQRDPLNPALRINVGGIYYAARNYDLAIRFFTDAANLKPDYANAYYNLAIALRDKGDLQNAQQVAEQAVNLLRDNQNTPDYKEATDLVTDVKERIAAGGTNEQGQTQPAGQQDSALDNPNLPDVDVANLNNPPQEVATPAAVSPNPRVNLPQATPSPRVTTAPTTPAGR
jgi:tetratricopeptide (TPR) repeat protein